MTFTYDQEADAVYIRLADAPYQWGHDLDSDRRFDFGPNNQPIGIELLNVSLGVDPTDLPQHRAVEDLLRTTGITILIPAHS